MKKLKQFILLIIPLLLLTACNVDYNLTENNDGTYDEIIKLKFDKNNCSDGSATCEENINTMLNTVVEVSNYPRYNKTYKENGDKVDLVLKYRYSSFDELKEKNPYDTVYQNVEINKFHILLSNPSQDMEHSSNVKYKGTIKLNHFIEQTNGKKVKGKNNSYYWKFNSNNVSKVNINISDKTNNEIKKQNNIYIYIIIFAVLTIGLIIILLVIKGKKMKKL